MSSWTWLEAASPTRTVRSSITLEVIEGRLGENRGAVDPYMICSFRGRSPRS